LSLLDRIKARINGGDSSFNASYSEAKQEISSSKKPEIVEDAMEE
jgi:hypothetical protein